MSEFALFDTSAFVEAPPSPADRAPAPPRQLTGNPILDGPVAGPSVAGCSSSVANRPAPEEAQKPAVNPTDESPGRHSVATVATVAGCQKGISQLAAMERPSRVSPQRWARLVRDAQSFDRVWLDRAVALGWTVQEMFGCFRNPLAGRLDHQGLVHGLNGRPVLDLDVSTAKIAADNHGVVWTFRRAFDLSAAVPIWDAYRGVE